MDTKKKTSIEEKIKRVTTIIFIIFAIGCCVSFLLPPLGVISNVWLHVGTAAVVANFVANLIEYNYNKH